MFTYSQYVTQLANLLAVPTNDSDFQTVLPNIIDDAEQRIYRELNLLDTVVRDSSAGLTANSRNFTLPQSNGRFVTVTGVNVLSPANSTVGNGTRNPLQPAWRNLLDYLYPTETAPSTPSVPKKFAMISDQLVIVGPAPDAAYNVEVIGTIRPAALSSTNVTTYLSVYLPDLFMDASMIFGAAYQQNFGASNAVDNSGMAVSWEKQYETHFASANTEETRKR